MSFPILWQEAAVWLAPFLIDDMSLSDEEAISRIPSRVRGYARGWLTREKTEISQLALLISNKIGTGPGTLTY